MIALLTLLAPALAGETASLLLCVERSSCQEDAAWARGLELTQGRELLVAETLVAFDQNSLAERSPSSLFRAAMDDAYLAAGRGRWREVEAAIERAGEALDDWAGSPLSEELFDYYALQGAAAVHRRSDLSYLYSFRQAAAVTGVRTAPELPFDDRAARRGWLDALRTLAVEGEGHLAFGALPPGTQITIDGSFAGSGDRPIALPPGNHRVVVEAPGQLRSIVVEVPVLAGRTTEAELEIPEDERLDLLLAAVDATFEGQPPPEALLTLLTDWCEQRGVSALQLLRVEHGFERPLAPGVALSEPDPLRPEAADGEALDLGEGVPVTAAREIARRFEEAMDSLAPEEYRRIQVIWFDPSAGHINLHQPPATPLPLRAVSLWVGAAGGWLSAMDRQHAGGAISLEWRPTPLGVEAQLGAVRAERDYRLYPGWSDALLYRGYAGLSATPSWRVAPTAGLGIEVLAPVALGPRGSLGLEAELARGWALRLEGGASWLDGAPAPSASARLARGY